MALFGDEIAREIIALIGRRQRTFDDASHLARDLKLLIGVANGELQRTDSAIRRVELALTRLLDLLFGNAMGTRSAPPDEFWRSGIGILVSRARWWVSVDDLISISNAAAFAFGENSQANRMRISRAIESGVLEWIPDPSVSNPQQNKRVLLSQVERLRDLKRLPE